MIGDGLGVTTYRRVRCRGLSRSHALPEPSWTCTPAEATGDAAEVVVEVERADDAGVLHAVGVALVVAGVSGHHPAPGGDLREGRQTTACKPGALRTDR